MMLGQIRLASATYITFFRSNLLISFEAVITHVVLVFSNGITPTGFPHRAGRACCSTEAKKPSKSRYRRAIVVGFLVGLVKNCERT
jgi:hypothetical protein